MSLAFTISRNSFLDKLSYFQNICAKKGTLAILSNILLESDETGIFLNGTDLEISLRIHINASIQNPGALTVPAKKIFEVVRESSSEVISFEEKDNSWAEIKAGFSTYNLAGIPKEEFPEFPEFENDGFTTLKSDVFLDLIEKVIFSIASEQENIYSLTSVLFEKDNESSRNILRMVSSDGHRLSIMEKEVDVDIDMITVKSETLIPKKGIQEWKKFCESRDFIQIKFENHQLVIKDIDSLMIIRLKIGEFPKYSEILKTIKKVNILKINRISFLESLKRINLFTEDIFHTIQLRISDDKMILSSQNSDLGSAKDELVIHYIGEPLLLGFNCRYFIETLQVMEGEYVDAFIDSNNSPCLMQSEEDNGFVSIIMPMQL